MSSPDYYYSCTLNRLKSEPTQISLRQFDFESYEQATAEKIAANLLSFRKTLGLPQESFANAIGVSRPQYRKYEQGIDIIRLDIAHRIAIKFGLPVFFLVAGSPYQALLNIPNKDSSFDKIWLYANALNDQCFDKLCEMLAIWAGQDYESLDKPAPPKFELNFERVLQENEESIYIAMAEGIRAIRQFFECSQEQIAESMGVSLSTYREYERPTQRPRYNLLVAVRWTAATGIHPFYALAGTEFLNIREVQNYRIGILMKILSGLTKSDIITLVPLVEGVYKTSALAKGALVLQTPHKT